MTDQQAQQPQQQMPAPAAPQPAQQYQQAQQPIPQAYPQPMQYAVPNYTPQDMQKVPAAPTPANVYQQIIEQQRQQLEAMQAQNEALNAQVVSFINNGAQFPQQQVQQQAPQVGQNWAVQPVQFAPIYEGNGFAPASLAQDVDVSLESLASKIGKKDE